MNMSTLSIFIDESGDFGKYQCHSPYYLLTLVLHNQDNQINEKLFSLDSKLNYYYPNKTKTVVHAGPIIRGEEIFRQIDLGRRQHIFNTLLAFSISVNINYATISVDKKEEDGTPLWLNTKLVKGLNEFIDANLKKLLPFDKIVIYYDGGQKEISSILNSFFNTRFNAVEFRQVKPHEYRLFQVADLFCTLELLKLKKDSNSFSKSENLFFKNPRNFNKNYYKAIKKKKINC